MNSNRRVFESLILVLLLCMISGCDDDPPQTPHAQAWQAFSSVRTSAERALVGWDSALKDCADPSLPLVEQRVKQADPNFDPSKLRWPLAETADVASTRKDLADLPVFWFDGGLSNRADGGMMGVLPRDHMLRKGSKTIGLRTSLCEVPADLAIVRDILSRDYGDTTSIEDFGAWTAALKQALEALPETPGVNYKGEGRRLEPDPKVPLAVVFEHCEGENRATYEGTGSSLGLVFLQAFRCTARFAVLEADGRVSGLVSATSELHEPKDVKITDRASVEEGNRFTKSRALKQARERLIKALDG